MLHSRFPIHLAIAAVVAAVLATPAAAQPSLPERGPEFVSARIEPSNDSGANGLATADVQPDGSTRLTIDLPGACAHA
jgi:hypothetical protein